MLIPAKSEARSQRSEARVASAKRDLALAGVVLASGLWLLALPSRAQDATTLLSQMKSAEATVSYSATLSGMGGTARVYRSGRKRRLEWLAPSIKRGDVLVDDGAHVWLYHRAEKSATKTDSRGRVPGFSPAGVAAPITLTGRRAFSVPVTGQRTLVIDAQTKTLLALRGGNGGFALSNIRFGAIPAAKFGFAAPRGVQVTSFDGVFYANIGAAKRAARWLRTPSTLPSGWSFESAVAGANSAWLRYSNGQTRFSLFEQPTTDGYLAPQSVSGGKFWRKNGVRFLATGISGSALDELIKNLP